MVQQVKKCKGITTVKKKEYLPYYCETHDTYTTNPTRLCKDCLRRKQEDTLWCKLINDFD